MSDSQDQLVRALKTLQVTASRCASLFTTSQLKVEFQVAYSNAAPLPWRLLEIHRAAKEVGVPRLMRRMHCYPSAESLELSIQERTTWKAKDHALVASHWMRVRASLAKAASRRSGEQGAEPSTNDPNGDLKALTATRQALRAQMCRTRPGRVVDLPNR
jgi:hypothetical protein